MVQCCHHAKWSGQILRSSSLFWERVMKMCPSGDGYCQNPDQKKATWKMHRTARPDSFTDSTKYLGLHIHNLHTKHNLSRALEKHQTLKASATMITYKKDSQTTLLNSCVIHHKTSSPNSWTQEWQSWEEEYCTREFVSTKPNEQSITPSHTQAAAAPIIHLVAEIWFPYTCRITLPSLTTSNWAIWEWEKLHKSIMSKKTKEKKKTPNKTEKWHEVAGRNLGEIHAKQSLRN